MNSDANIYFGDKFIGKGDINPPSFNIDKYCFGDGINPVKQEFKLLVSEKTRDLFNLYFQVHHILKDVKCKTIIFYPRKCCTFAQITFFSRGSLCKAIVRLNNKWIELYYGTKLLFKSDSITSYVEFNQSRTTS